MSVDYLPTGDAPEPSRPIPVSTPSGRELPNGSIIVDETSATGFRRNGDEHKCPKKYVGELTALCQLRDQALDYLEDPTEAARFELRVAWDDYHDHYGPINRYKIPDAEIDEDTAAKKPARRYPSMGGFRKFDPSFWTVAALEEYDDDTRTAVPAAILRTDTVDTVEAWPDAADDINIAAINSLSRHHRLDIGYIAAQLGVEVPAAEAQLEAVAYRTEDGWEIADRYLSGDVVGKLADAERLAAGEDRYRRNVDALRGVLPERIPPADITVEFGVTWLTPADIAEFIDDHRGGEIDVGYHPPTGIWSYTGTPLAGPQQFRTNRYSMAQQVMRACNAENTTVMRSVEDAEGNTTKVVDDEATAAEQLTRDNLTEALATWCWAEPAGADRLADRYNQLYNRHRAETWSGAHLELPGLSGDFTPRPHQKDVVWRILAAGHTGTLMAHGVGAGKTAAMIIAAQEARRSGRVTGTSLFAVPKNMIEQFSRDALSIYPQARVITPMPTSSNTRSSSVREFAARVATGDFDIAVCSHGDLKSIPMSPDAERRAVQTRLDDFAGYDHHAGMSKRAAKKIARDIEKMESRLAELRDASEDPAATYFDRMGVGMLFVDEAHLAKNIALNTSRDGLPLPAASARAEAILARADWIREHHGDRAVVMATATPVTNSPAEMWVAARLVAPQTLERAGIRHFDAFAANFLTPVDDVELDEKQQLKVRTRLGEYQNFPDLGRIFRSFTDVKPTDTLGFKLPDLAGGQPTLHVSTPSLQQQTAIEWAKERADGLHLNGGSENPDPVIAIMGMLRTAALHPAAVAEASQERYATLGHPNPGFEWDEPNPKLIETADTIADIHHRTADWTYPNSTRPGAAQAVFCDLGVPKRGQPSVYQILTELLVERDVSRDEIAWVHDIPDPDRRQPLWDDVRNGRTRIMIGSMAQMGVGVNIQTRLYAMHELTAPMRPDWLEQAEGRGIRQGNHHDTIELHRYVTERTADANAWQMLRRKQHFISQALSDPAQLGGRVLVDESTQTKSEEFAQISAIATGDERQVLLAQLNSTISRLERAERAHQRAVTNQQTTIDHQHHLIGNYRTRIAAIGELSPNPNADALEVGRKLAVMRRWTSGRIELAGVTWNVRNHDTIRMEIPDTGIERRIDHRDSRTDAATRGLGQIVLNEHNKLGERIANLEHRIIDAEQRIIAEQDQPVPAEFQRHDELEHARHERARIQTEIANDTGGQTSLDTIDAAQHIETARTPHRDRNPGQQQPSAATSIDKFTDRPVAALAPYVAAFADWHPDHQHPDLVGQLWDLPGDGRPYPIGRHHNVPLKALRTPNGEHSLHIDHSAASSYAWPTLHWRIGDTRSIDELERWISQQVTLADTLATRHDLPGVGTLNGDPPTLNDRHPNAHPASTTGPIYEP